MCSLDQALQLVWNFQFFWRIAVVVSLATVFGSYKCQLQSSYINIDVPLLACTHARNIELSRTQHKSVFISGFYSRRGKRLVPKYPKCKGKRGKYKSRRGGPHICRKSQFIGGGGEATLPPVINVLTDG